jgi:hypothetical protein
MSACGLWLAVLVCKRPRRLSLTSSLHITEGLLNLVRNLLQEGSLPP